MILGEKLSTAVIINDFRINQKPPPCRITGQGVKLKYFSLKLDNSARLSPRDSKGLKPLLVKGGVPTSRRPVGSGSWGGFKVAKLLNSRLPPGFPPL